MGKEQCTLARTLTFEGVGIHTGEDCQITVSPAPIDTGYIFWHYDDGRYCYVSPENVYSTNFGVTMWLTATLESKAVFFHTVEHLLSALVGMDIHNAEIVFHRGSEVPALDGSSLLFATKFARHRLPQNEPARELSVGRYHLSTYDYGAGEISIKSSYNLSSNRLFYAGATIDFPAPVYGQSFGGMITPEFYLKEIAPARTFGFKPQVEYQRTINYSKGSVWSGDKANCIIFDENKPMVDLRWKDEPVRHKILDLIGDLAFFTKGKYPTGRIHSTRGGHDLNIRFVKAIS